MVPGHDPLAAIDAIEDLDDPGPRLLVVDQFEEVFASLPTVVDGFATRLLDLAGDPPSTCTSSSWCAPTSTARSPEWAG